MLMLLNGEKMKLCPKCGVEKEPSDFYRDRSRKDGLTCWCKECMRECQQSAAYKKSQKKYQQSAAYKEHRREYNQSAKGKEVSRKSDQKKRIKHPEKIKARHAVNNAVADGRLIPRPCFCGELEVEGHHEDYGKPLDVEWLCKKHHMEKETKDES